MLLNMYNAKIQIRNMINYFREAHERSLESEKIRRHSVHQDIERFNKEQNNHKDSDESDETKNKE